MQLAERALSCEVPGAVEQRLRYAVDEARESDERRHAGRARSALDGVPFGVKANLDVTGIVTTNGTGLSGVPADANADAVKALRGVGMIPVLTTTMAEAAVGAVTANPHTGVCPNPRDSSLNAGGSSGGSAAVVAADALPAALGSDTMGSVRVPASYCAVSGFKPTRGSIDVRGLAPLGGMLDTVGVLAHAPGDVRLVAHELLPAAKEPLPARPPRVAVPALAYEEDSPAAHHLLDVIGRLTELGATIVTETGPTIEPGRVRRLGLLLCELTLLGTYEQAYGSGDPGLSDGLRGLLDYAAVIEDAPARLAQVNAELAQISADIRAVVADFDFLVLPVTPGRVPGLLDDPPDAADLTAWVNVAGLPAVTMPPVGPRRREPGASIQLIGNPESDRQLLDLAVHLDEVSS